MKAPSMVAAVLALLASAACSRSGDDGAAPAPMPGGAIEGLPDEPVAVGEVVILDGSTLVPPPGPAIAEIAWDWGDGAVQADPPAVPASHSYSEPGRYAIAITARYDDGRAVSWTAPVVVYDPAAPVVEETARGIPLARAVDVVVVGGTSGAVAAAAAARRAGASVFLAAPRPYLGEDMCGPLLTWLESGETPPPGLAGELFSESPARPMHLKRVLDRALEEAGVEFITGSFVTEVLRDGGGDLAGVVIGNRTGRQAVAAKVIVDATDRAWVARMAGAAFAPYPAGPQQFTRVVIGGGACSGPGIVPETMPFQIEGRPVHRYTLTIDMADGSWRSFALAEQIARDMTWDVGQADDSDTLFQVPPDPMNARAEVTGPWPGADAVDLDAFRPAGIDRLYVLGGCANVSRAAAAAMLRPVELIGVGERIGAAAAADAAAAPAPSGARLPGGPVCPARFGDTSEILAGLRPTDQAVPSVPAEARGIPVIGRYDVVVIGAGTAGAPAGIAAGRSGASTLIVEYLHGMGGISTLGLIGSYYYGYRGGFTAELDAGVAGMGSGTYVVKKSEWYRRQNRAAGTEIWYGALGCGAFKRGSDVRGVVVATPQGRGVVLAEVVADSTGNADVAAAAGAECTTTDGSTVAVQGAGLPPVALGASYTNTDFTFIDDTDATDLWHVFLWAREKFSGYYDLAQIADTRERRRIVGDFTMTPMDIVNRRRYPDTVVYSYSNFDSHGFTVHPYFLICPPDSAGIYVDVPYRCLLPAGLDGIIVTGLGISAHRDAMPVIRMQPDVQNQGYAAGLAAATAAAAGVEPRAIDVKALQAALVAKGNLPSRVLTDVDSYPYSAARIQEAVDALTSGPGIIVDDDDPAPAFQVTGTWTKSTSIPGYFGSGYRHNGHVTGTTATFTPTLPAGGAYDVYLRWTAEPNRDSAVKVTVNHKNGSSILSVNQEIDGGEWNLLGTYEFDAGASGSVVLEALRGGDSDHVIADAVCFAEPGSVLMDPAAALAVVLTDTATAIPMLRARHDGAATPAAGKLAAARILGMLGDATGASTLAAKVSSYPSWDTGWNFRGMGQYGASISELDSYVIALGRTRAAGTALGPILDKLMLLNAEEEFSHHRAVAIALEALGDPAAAAPLAALLTVDGMTGHHVTSMAEARARYGTDPNENGPRNLSLRELHIARALFRCGDYGGIGAAILANYAGDLRGHYSRHARAILAGR